MSITVTHGVARVKAPHRKLHCVDSKSIEFREIPEQQLSKNPLDSGALGIARGSS